nr:EpsG family protein [Geothrix paludis]
MGLRPISGRYFVDMGTYAFDFKRLQGPGAPPVMYGAGEWAFAGFMKASAAAMSAETWFLLCAALYVGVIAWAVWRVHGPRAAYPTLLMAVSSFSFWAYGTNGIRNGLATSLVLLGMAFRDRKIPMALIFILAIGTHASAILPIAVFLLTFVYANPMAYLGGYLFAVLLSLTMGGWWEQAFAASGLMGDGRFSGYLVDQSNAQAFSATGFRWDFLAYSLWPIAMGGWQIFRNRFTDRFYLQLFNTYVAANAFWVLVIRASFSNRFAYLSWFLMSWVMVYPLLADAASRGRNRALAGVLLAYFGFTYLMFLKG